MPLRTLIYAVVYWEREWKAWEDRHEAGVPLRLTPVLPIVFHTGGKAWSTHRELSDLIAGPESVRKLAPQWRPLFWDLAEKSVEDLLQGTGDWLRSLSVVRGEREQSERFRQILREVLSRWRVWPTRIASAGTT